VSSPDEINKWLAIPGAAGGLGLVLWLLQFFSKTRLGMRSDEAQGGFVEASLKTSSHWMNEAQEADKRARANYDLFLAASQRAAVAEAAIARVPMLEDRVRVLESHLNMLARMMVEMLPDSKPFVQQWIKDSGFGGLDPFSRDNVRDKLSSEDRDG
jgi:hypothetical protein